MKTGNQVNMVILCSLRASCCHLEKLRALEMSYLIGEFSETLFVFVDWIQHVQITSFYTQFCPSETLVIAFNLMFYRQTSIPNSFNISSGWSH